MKFEEITANLNQRGIDFEEVHFCDTAISARTTDTSLGKNFDPQNAIKTLIVSAKNEMFAVILRGDAFIESQKLKAQIGRWNVVDKETIQNELGQVVGGICPLVLNMPILIDNQVMDLEIWSMGAGSIDKGINVKRDSALTNLNNFSIVEIAKNA